MVRPTKGAFVRNAILITLAGITIAGCVTTTPTAPTISTLALVAAFDATEAKSLLADGKNSIKGSSFMRQQGGGVVTCAGQTVSLVPATAYATERIAALYGNTERGTNNGRRYKFVPDPPEFLTSIKTTRCDAQGNFAFDRIADGTFYINTLVVWQIGYSQQGGQLMQRVSVKEGQSLVVVVAP